MPMITSLPEKRSFLNLMIRLPLVLWVVTALVFGLIHLAPGDPAAIILSAQSETPSPQKVAELRERMGLNRSLPEQYIAWLGRTARLDLGRSFRSGEPVTSMIWARLPATVELALTTMVFMVFFSTLTGAAAALRQDGSLDRLGRMLTIVILSIPGYWLGLLLIYFFSLRLGLFPVFGREGAISMVLPTVTLGLSAAMSQGRILRASLLEIMSRDFILFARAKGIRNRTLFFRHILKSALPPVLTLWGTAFGRLLGGAVLVESVFAWPGLGRLTAEAVISRDIPVVQGTVLFMAFAFVLVNLAVDLLCEFANPRLVRGRTHGNAA
jgi:peptide/nickel transport system permease protein